MRYYVTGTFFRSGGDESFALTFKARDLSDALLQFKFFEYGLEVGGMGKPEVDAITTKKPRGVDFAEIS